MSDSYEPIFDPERMAEPASGVLSRVSPFGVSRPPEVYVYHDCQTMLAVNLALATGRPLLLSGLPGSGKTTLPRHVAQCLGWEYLEEVVTSRTQARDLQWRFDALRRLRDAQVRRSRIQDLSAYVEPGVLWWAFAPAAAYAASAFARGRTARGELAAIRGTVVLLDEIDKAEPDIPNDLLIPLGVNRILVEETARTVPQQIRPLVCITTNGERELPQAFLRRCVTHKLSPPSPEDLAAIGRKHHPEIEESVLSQVIALFGDLNRQAGAKGLRAPSIAELLDALLACKSLKAKPAAAALNEIAVAAMWKDQENRPDTVNTAGAPGEEG
ncbi:MAG TPA: MoxR family ATPase [Thermoanaerobaculia bacterium]